MEYQISKESAQEQIDLLLNTSAVNVDDIESDILKNALKSSINVLINAIRRGLLEIAIDDDGNMKIIQILSRNNNKPITYKEMTGQAKIIMGKIADDNSYERAYTLLGYLSGLGIEAIRTFKEPDLGIAECLSAVFLGI
jgi:hypothetical protein